MLKIRQRNKGKSLCWLQKKSKTIVCEKLLSCDSTRSSALASHCALVFRHRGEKNKKYILLIYIFYSYLFLFLLLSLFIIFDYVLLFYQYYYYYYHLEAKNECAVWVEHTRTCRVTVPSATMLEFIWSHFAIFERRDRTNKKLAVSRFYSLFLSVQYDDWKQNEKEDQQKQYSCIKNTPE